MCLWHCIFLNGLRLHLAQTRNRRPDRNRARSIKRIRPSRHSLLAGLARPDACARALDVVLSAEVAVVLAVLGDFDLLYDLAESSAVTGSVLSDDSDLLCAATHGLIWTDAEKREREREERREERRMEGEKGR